MPDLQERLVEIGFTKRDIQYLTFRGNGSTRSEALRSKTAGNMNSVKAARFYNRFCNRTNWLNEDDHVRVGQWLAKKSPRSAPPSEHKCTACATPDPKAFSLYPVELRCDACLTDALKKYIQGEKDLASRRSKLGMQLAKEADEADSEADATGRITIPRLRDILSLGVELGGGWKEFASIIPEVMQNGSVKDKFGMIQKVFSILEAIEKESKVTVDITGLPPAEADIVIADAMLAVWHREHERSAIRAILLERGIAPPDEEESDEC